MSAPLRSCRASAVLLAVGIAILSLAMVPGAASMSHAKSIFMKDEPFKCDTSVINAKAVTDKWTAESKETCLGFCARIDEAVTDMSANAADKKCLESARALSILNKQFFDIATDIAGASKRWDKTFQAEVTQQLDILHNQGSCLSLLMPDWTARTAACQNDNGNKAQLERIFMVLLQYYNPHGPEYAFSPDPDKPDPKSYCAYEIMDFMAGGANLFDLEACAGKHPVWSTMEECPLACWIHIKSKMNQGGCISVYYDTMFQVIYSSGKKLQGSAESQKATKTALTVADLVTDKTTTIDTKCKDELPPCTPINKALAECAKDAKEANLVTYYSTAIKVDAFGGSSKGGVKCKQGTNCL